MSDVQNTLNERGTRYGDFADHANIAWDIKNAIRAADKWEALPHMHKQALDVIADKIARILNGDPNYADNWHDIQGYARLVEERLLTVSPPVEDDGTFEAEGMRWTPWDCRGNRAHLGPEGIDSVTRVLLRDGRVLRVKKSPASSFTWGLFAVGSEGNEIVGYGTD